MSAAGLKEEIAQALREMRGGHLSREGALRTYLFDSLEEETAKEMEAVRLGRMIYKAVYDLQSGI